MYNLVDLFLIARQIPVTVMRCTLPDCEVVIVEVKEGNTTYLGDEFLEADYPPVRYSRVSLINTLSASYCCIASVVLQLPVGFNTGC